MRREGMTLQVIADVLDVGVKTAHPYVESALPPDKVDGEPECIVGKDGKARSAKYKPRTPKTILVTSEREEQRAQTLLRSTPTASSCLPS